MRRTFCRKLPSRSILINESSVFMRESNFLLICTATMFEGTFFWTIWRTFREKVATRNLDDTALINNMYGCDQIDAHGARTNACHTYTAFIVLIYSFIRSFHSFFLSHHGTLVLWPIPRNFYICTFNSFVVYVTNLHTSACVREWRHVFGFVFLFLHRFVILIVGSEVSSPALVSNMLYSW